MTYGADGWRVRRLWTNRADGSKLVGLGDPEVLMRLARSSNIRAIWALIYSHALNYEDRKELGFLINHLDRGWT